MDITVNSQTVTMDIAVQDGPTIQVAMQAPVVVDMTTVGMQGPPGPSTAEFGATAIGAVSALRCVSSQGSGVALTDPASVQSLALIAGIAITAAADGGLVTIRRTGQVSDAAWAWTPGLPVFSGPSGILTQVPPGTVATRQIGAAVSATTLQIDLSDLILME